VTPSCLQMDHCQKAWETELIHQLTVAIGEVLVELVLKRRQVQISHPQQTWVGELAAEVLEQKEVQVSSDYACSVE